MFCLCFQKKQLGNAGGGGAGKASQRDVGEAHRDGGQEKKRRGLLNNRMELMSILILGDVPEKTPDEGEGHENAHEEIEARDEQ